MISRNHDISNIKKISLKLKWSAGERLLVGVAGIPGAGKSTFARNLVAALSSVDGDGCAQLITMDGFHLTKHQLDQMPVRPRYPY